MSKKHGLKSIVVLCMLLVFLSASTIASASATVELKWSQPQVADHPWTVIGQKICDEVEKETNGRIKITQYPSNSLGTETEALNMLRDGSLAILTSGPAIFDSFYDPVQVFALPYLFKDKEQAYKILEGEIGQKIFNDIILKKSGIRTIAFWYFGIRTLTTKDIEVKKPSDLEGVKVRSQDDPVAINVIRALGASPIPVSFTELYISLQTGVVQGQENPIATIYFQKFYEVQKYIILTNHSVHLGTVSVSEKIWQELSKEDQKIILDVFQKNKPLIDQEIDGNNEEYIEFMKQKGVKVITPDVEAFSAYAKESIQKAYGSNKEWMDLIKQIDDAK